MKIDRGWLIFLLIFWTLLFAFDRYVKAADTIKTTVSAEFTQEQYEYFAQKNGWNPDSGESAVDYAKAVVVAEIKRLVSGPIQRDTIDAYVAQGEAAAKQAAAEIEAQVKLVE